jgi:hypothetical protein
MDDDLGQATRVHSNFYYKCHLDVYGPHPPRFKSWRDVYNRPINYGQLLEEIDRLSVFCNNVGASLGGFATIENPYFRPGKYSYWRSVATGIHIAKRGNLKKLKGGEYAHDQWQSAYKMATDGIIVSNNFVRVHTVPFGEPETGLGTAEARRPKLTQALKDILKEFPGLLKSAGYPNLHYVHRSRKTLDEWRRINGYLK